MSLTHFYIFILSLLYTTYYYYDSHTITYISYGLHFIIILRLLVPYFWFLITDFSILKVYIYTYFWFHILVSYFWFLLASVMSRFRSSVIKTNKREESGKPFLRPWITLKEYDGVLLIRTTKFVDLTRPKIQLTVSNVKPIYNEISLNRVQLTLS